MTTPATSGSGDNLTYELLQEVRDLSASVRALHTVFVKRKVLYLVLGVESFIVAAALVAAFILVGINNSNTQHIVRELVDTCGVRNAQIDSTKTYLSRTQALQAESESINAKLLSQLNLRLSAADTAKLMQIQADYNKTLHDYFVAQPADIPCKAYKTGG